MTNLECVPVLEAVGDQFALGHLIQPVQLTTTVLAAVERREPLETPLQLYSTTQHTTIHQSINLSINPGLLVA